MQIAQGQGGCRQNPASGGIGVELRGVWNDIVEFLMPESVVRFDPVFEFLILVVPGVGALEIALVEVVFLECDDGGRKVVWNTDRRHCCEQTPQACRGRLAKRYADSSPTPRFRSCRRSGAGLPLPAIARWEHRTAKVRGGR
jgi:hypothetical protein